MKEFNPNNKPLYTPCDVERGYFHALAMIQKLGREIARTNSITLKVKQNRYKQHARHCEKQLGWKYAA